MNKSSVSTLSKPLGQNLNKHVLAVVTTIDSKNGLHMSRKGRKQVFANMFFNCPDMAWSPYRCNDHIDLSQEIFAIDMLTALKSSLEHRRKHLMRLLQLHMETRLAV